MILFMFYESRVSDCSPIVDAYVPRGQVICLVVCNYRAVLKIVFNLLPNFMSTVAHLLKTCLGNCTLSI